MKCERHGEQPAYYLSDCTMMCAVCYQENIDKFLKSNPKKAAEIRERIERFLKIYGSSSPISMGCSTASPRPCPLCRTKVTDIIPLFHHVWCDNKYLGVSERYEGDECVIIGKQRWNKRVGTQHYTMEVVSACYTKEEWNHRRAGKEDEELCPCDNHPPEDCETCRGACSCHFRSGGWPWLELETSTGIKPGEFFMFQGRLRRLHTPWDFIGKVPPDLTVLAAIQKHAEYPITEPEKQPVQTNTEIDPEELKSLAQFIDARPIFRHEEGDYWQEDQNGVMCLCRKSGRVVMMMNKVEYEALKEWGDESHDKEEGGKVSST